MGNLITKSAIENIKLINFDYFYNNLNKKIVLINTLSEYEQECLIINTLSIKHEIEVINNLLSKDKNKEIIIYGKNCSDHTVFKKYLQLNNLGFKNIKIYNGGLFEWLLLQDIYGNDKFITTENILDILKFK